MYYLSTTHSRSVHFSGASGPVSFGDNGAFPGSRTWEQASFGVFNMFPDGAERCVGVCVCVWVCVVVCAELFLCHGFHFIS